MPDDTETTAPTEATPLAFTAFVQQQRGGLLNSELTAELAKVVAGVVELCKPGSLTLQISIAPAKVNGALMVVDKVTAKPPEPDRDAALFYATAEGQLSRRDPRQPELPFPHAVDTPRRTA